MITNEKIIENVKKLKSLGMKNEDIIDNLTKLGISEEDAKDVVTKISNEANKKQKPKKEDTELSDDFLYSDIEKETLDEKKENDKNKVKKPKNDEIIVNDDIDLIKDDDFLKLKNIGNEKEEEKNFEENKTEKNNDNTNYENNNYKENVWQSGLLSTINSKLSEMEIKQKEIDENVQKRINIEIIKIKKLQDILKDELNRKINTTLAEQEKQVNDFVIRQLSQIKIEQAKLTKNIEVIKKEKEEVEELIKGIKDSKAELLNISNEIKDKADRTNIINNTKLNSKIKQINEVLSLQSKITQSLIKNTQTKINEETNNFETIINEIKNKNINLKAEYEKTYEKLKNEFINKTKESFQKEIKTLNEFKDNIKKEISPEKVQEVITKLEDFKEKLYKRYEEKFNSVKTEFLKNTDIEFKKEKNKLEEFKNQMKEIIDPKKIYDVMSKMDEFKDKLYNKYENMFKQLKDEFLSESKLLMQEEIDNKLKDINELKETVIQKTDPKIISDKLEELNIFEKNLISNIDEKISQSLKIYESTIDQQIKGKIGSLDEKINKLNQYIIKAEMIQETQKDLDKFKEQFITIINKNVDKMNALFSKLEEKSKKA